MTKNFKPIFTITNRITAGLTRIERVRGFLEAACLRRGFGRQDNSLNIEGLRFMGRMEKGYEEGCTRGANKTEARETLVFLL